MENFLKNCQNQKKKFVCTTYVVYYTTFVGQSYHIRGILYHICGILYHKCVFPGNPYTDKYENNSFILVVETVSTVVSL